MKSTVGCRDRLAANNHCMSSPGITIEIRVVASYSHRKRKTRVWITLVSGYIVNISRVILLNFSLIVVDTQN